MRAQAPIPPGGGGNGGGDGGNDNAIQQSPHSTLRNTQGPPLRSPFLIKLRNRRTPSRSYAFLIRWGGGVTVFPATAFKRENFPTFVGRLGIQRTLVRWYHVGLGQCCAAVHFYRSAAVRIHSHGPTLKKCQSTVTNRLLWCHIHRIAHSERDWRVGTKECLPRGLEPNATALASLRRQKWYHRNASPNPTRPCSAYAGDTTPLPPKY